MTLRTYDPDKLDDLALRIYDLGGAIRHMSLQARENEPTSLSLQDRKALEWLNCLEEWTLKAQADLDMALIRQRGVVKALGGIKKAPRGKKR